MRAPSGIDASTVLQHVVSNVVFPVLHRQGERTIQNVLFRSFGMMFRKRIVLRDVPQLGTSRVIKPVFDVSQMADGGGYR